MNFFSEFMISIMNFKRYWTHHHVHFVNDVLISVQKDYKAEHALVLWLTSYYVRVQCASVTQSDTSVPCHILFQSTKMARTKIYGFRLESEVSLTKGDLPVAISISFIQFMEILYNLISHRTHSILSSRLFFSSITIFSILTRASKVYDVLANSLGHCPTWHTHTQVWVTVKGKVTLSGLLYVSTEWLRLLFL